MKKRGVGRRIYKKHAKKIIVSLEGEESRVVGT